MQFKSLDHLQRFLEKNAPSILGSKEVEKILALTMRQSVYEVVYGHYVPVRYERLRDRGGLSDPRNMHITQVEVKDGVVRILFENLRASQTHFQLIYQNQHVYEKLHGKFIVDTIEEGIEADWYETGKWSEARPFVADTVRRIKADPSYLINAIKSAYRKAGFHIK